MTPDINVSPKFIRLLPLCSVLLWLYTYYGIMRTSNYKKILPRLSDLPTNVNCDECRLPEKYRKSQKQNIFLYSCREFNEMTDGISIGPRSNIHCIETKHCVQHTKLDRYWFTVQNGPGTSVCRTCLFLLYIAVN